MTAPQPESGEQRAASGKQPSSPPSAFRLLTSALLWAGLAGIILSRDLLQLYIAWEIAGLAVWLALTRGTGWRGGRRWLLLSLHSPGWILLAVLLLGLAVPLVPPPVGV